MKINFPVLDDALSIDGPTILTIEDTKVFSQLVQQFYSYDENSSLKLFDHQFKAIKAAELLVVTDILGFDLNAPSVLKLIHADLENQLNDKPEVKSMIDKLAATITELIAYECLENELDLDYDEITILELIKALGVKVETASDTVFEKSLELIQIFKYLQKKQLLVFINACSYLLKEELEELMSYCQLSQVKVLFLEPRRVDGFKQYVLDEDYILMTENMV